MATKDITRFLHQPIKQYKSVRVQQGRSLLDSDYNEGTRLREEDRRRLLLDAFGRVASPDEGFTLAPPGSDTPLPAGLPLRVEQVQINGVSVGVYPVNIRPGSVYLGGMRFELGQLEHIAMQRDFLQLKAGFVVGLLPPVNPIVTSPLLTKAVAATASSPVSSPISGSPPRVFTTLQAKPIGQLASIALGGKSAIQLPNFQISQAFKALETSPLANSPDYPAFRYLYYLHAWEQVITPAEDDELLEKGLAGPDTSVRIKRMRRVEVLPLNLRENCAAALEKMVASIERTTGILDRKSFELRSRGRLRLFFQEPSTSTACPPCTPDPGARYLGTENQTIRIMQSSDLPTDGRSRFVWTNDNAAPLYRVSVSGLSGTGSGSEEIVLTMINLPKDVEHTPVPYQTVEIIPFAAILEGAESVRSTDPHYQRIADEVGAFVSVKEVRRPPEGGLQLVLDTSDRSRIDKIRNFVWRWDPRHPAAIADRNVPRSGDERFFFMRVWHVSGPGGQIELPLNSSTSGPPLGKTGIVPFFHSPGRRGDYWTATLRVDTRDRIVPFDLMSNPNGVPPHGPRHFYAPLAILSGDDQRVAAVEACSEQGRRLTDHGCASRTVGDGTTSFGDFENIEDAIDSLPLEGGLIEVRPGLYPHVVEIRNRSNITIRGCGPNTVLQTPRPSGNGGPGPALVEIDECSGITLSNVQLNVANQGGILVSQASAVTLSDLTIAAGTVDEEDDFDANEGNEPAPLVKVTAAAAVSFERGRIDSWNRPALLASSTQGLQISGLHVVGADDTGNFNTPTAPLFDFESTVAGVTLRNCIIEAFGQIGVRLGATDFELKSLTITTNEVDFDSESDEEALSAIELFEAARGRVEQCRMTMGSDTSDHAVMVVHGRDLIIEDNDVETLTLETGFRAWGGIQVRGGSLRVELRRNRVVGGLGHGITLGSATWNPNSLRKGAGFAQITSSRVTGDITAGEGGLLPAIDGPLQHVLIADNQIRNMGTNGISVLTVLGVPDALIEVRHAVIARNQISNNLLQIFDSGETLVTDLLPFGSGATNATVATSPHLATTLALRRLPYAGIALAVASGSLEIHGNVIANNAALGAGNNDGLERRLPINGIFVLVGDGIVIADNRIAGNGARPLAFDEPTSELLEGVRAGIAVMLAGPGVVTSMTALEERVGITAGTVPTFVVESAGTAARIENNSVQQPEGRALHLVGAGPISIEGNFFSSLGNHGPDTTEGHAMIGDCVFVENLGAPWEARDFDPADLTDFTKAGGSWMDTYLGHTDTASPRLFLALGGALSFQNNQVTYDWEIVRLDFDDPLSFFAVALLAVDHVSCNGNQIAQHLLFDDAADTSPEDFPDTPVIVGDRVPIDAPLLSQVYITAASAQVVRNRFSADQKSVFMSLVLNAELMAVIAHNQGTYQMIARVEAGNDLFNDGNQFLYVRDDQYDADELAFLDHRAIPYRDILRDKLPND